MFPYLKRQLQHLYGHYHFTCQCANNLSSVVKYVNYCLQLRCVSWLICAYDNTARINLLYKVLAVKPFTTIIFISQQQKLPTIPIPIPILISYRSPCCKSLPGFRRRLLQSVKHFLNPVRFHEVELTQN